MDVQERYVRAMEMRMASKKDIRAFARNVLIEQGIDPDIVDLKDEGVSIQAFNKLVNSLYLQGYADGMKESSGIRGKRREMEIEGKYLEHHKRVSANIAKKNLVNKIIN